VEQAGPQILHRDWSQVTASVRVSETKWSVLETERHIRALQSPHPRHGRLKMRLSSARRGGNVILRTEGLQVGYPGVALFETADIELRRRQVVALIGDNGTGKTTFLRTVMGKLDPLAGEVRLGASLDVGYFAQAQDALDSDESVLDEFMAHSGMLVAQAREYLARFLFRGDDVFKPVRALSGGERSRLALALLSQVKANLLLLDEPTNHLDIPAQEALQEALQAFEGTILMVTHDRYLVDKLATQIWDLRAGHLDVHKGGYQSYLAAREAALERARETNSWGAVNAARRRHPLADKPTANATAHAASKATAQAETAIEETERALQRLGEELASATVAQEWDRVHSLKREYEHTQTALDALLVQWEALAVT
jgi:ATP-binding cassette subfamily F protein 3